MAIFEKLVVDLPKNQEHHRTQAFDLPQVNVYVNASTSYFFAKHIAKLFVAGYVFTTSNQPIFLKPTFITIIILSMLFIRLSVKDGVRQLQEYLDEVLRQHLLEKLQSARQLVFQTETILTISMST